MLLATHMWPGIGHRCACMGNLSADKSAVAAPSPMESIINCRRTALSTNFGEN